jgi:hypothetical protein
VIDIAIVRIKAHARHIAKALVAVVVPIVVTGGFALLDDLANRDLPQPWPIVIAVVASALAVYRVPNAPKP